MYATAAADKLELFHNSEGSPAASTPAANGHRVVSYFGSFGLVCYDFKGKELWRFSLPLALSGGSYGSGTSPIIVGKRVILGVRPEHIEDAAIASDAPQDRRLAAVVDIREDLGSDVYVHFGVGGPPVLGEDVRAAVGSDAVETTAAQARRKGNLWIARVGHMSRAREGEPIELAVDTARLQFFDPETGDRIDAEPGDRPA